MRSVVLFQDPPLQALTQRFLSAPAPSAGPVGFLALPVGRLARCTSLSHSQTLPAMSCRPNGLGGKLPTGAVRWLSHWDPHPWQLARFAPASPVLVAYSKFLPPRPA